MEPDHLTEPNYGPGDAFAYLNEACHTAELSKALVDKCLPDGIHRSHYHIINHLVRHGDGLTPVQITAAMSVTKATISYSLSVLEKRGFISTRPSCRDGRSKKVFLTEPGRAFQKQTIIALTGLFGTFLRKEDIQIMGDALPTLVAIRKLLDENVTVTSG